MPLKLRNSNSKVPQAGPQGRRLLRHHLMRLLLPHLLDLLELEATTPFRLHLEYKHSD